MKLNGLFGKKLKELRENSGYTQQEFAELCGLHHTTIGMIEIGKRVPSFNKLEIFAEKLGVDYSTLFDFHNVERTSNPKQKLVRQLAKEIESLDFFVIKGIIQLVRSIKVSNIEK